MAMKVNNDYDIRKSYHTCIYDAYRSRSASNESHKDWINKAVDTFMDHHLNIYDTIIDKEQKIIWHNPSLRSNMYYYFQVYHIFLHSSSIIRLKRISWFIRHSYDNLSPLDVNIFDLFLILCSNPFIISNILTKDLIKLLPNYGTLALRFVSCGKLIALSNNPIYIEQQLINFIEELYNRCDKKLVYHIEAASRNINLDIKKSNENFKILNKYLNLFSRTLDEVLFDNIVNDLYKNLKKE